MNAFLTGSRAYGIPRPDSDIDIAILTDNETGLVISDIFYGGPVQQPDDRHESANGDIALKSGKFNLLIFTDPVKYRGWKRATEICVRSRPVTREDAIKCIDRCVEVERELVKLSQPGTVPGL